MNLKQAGSNQTVLHLDNGDEVFFSYETPVAAYIARSHGNIPGGYVRTEKKWSVTTSKHIGKWLSGIDARKVPQSVLDSLIAKVQA